MTRNRLLFFALSVALVLPLVTGTFLAASARGEGAGDDSLYKYLAVFTEVLTRIRDNWVEPIDVETLMDGALDGTTDALDSFSLYIPPDAVDAYLATQEVGSRHSGLVLLKDRGILYVAGVEQGSPAAGAGLRVGDIIAKLDGEPTRLMPLWQAREVFAGPPERKLVVEVIRYGESEERTLTLGLFEAPEPHLESRRGAGVLRISDLGPRTGEGVEKALAGALESRQDRLLVDLRGTAGGDPEVAYSVAALFTSGDLGALERRDTTLTTFTSDQPPRWQGRIAVLVNRGTLGAAEILATVLRQKLGATLVGERTFGYAGRQTMASLSSGGRLLYTDAFYTGPDGEPLRESLQPDLRVDDRSRLFDDSQELEEDPILERGLSVILGEEEVPAQEAA